MAAFTRVLDEMAAAGIMNRVELAWRARKLGDEISRGRPGKAAEATSRDAAKMVISALISSRGSMVAQEVRRIGNATAGHPIELAYSRFSDRNWNSIEHEIIPAGATFEDVINRIIDLQRNPGVRAHISRIGVSEEFRGEWPWLECGVNNGRFIFGSLDDLVFQDIVGRVREISIGVDALCRVSYSLGMPRHNIVKSTNYHQVEH